MNAREDVITPVGAVPSGAVLQRAAAILQRGGLVAYPTRCLYGLGASAVDRDAIGRVYQVKQRPTDKPLSILIPDRQGLAQWVADMPSGARRLMDRFWPGKVTLVFKASNKLPGELLGGTGRIGIRLPAHSVARALVTAFGQPLTATSANLSGRPGSVSVADMAPEMLHHLDLVLDAGELLGGAGSTVVDVTDDRPVVLREGVVSAVEIDSTW